MNPPDKKWPRLAAAARTAGDDRDTAAPYGFATRVAALAWADDRATVTLLEQFSLRALAFAGLLALGCVVVNYSTVLSVFQDDAAAVDDPVAEIVDLAS